MNNRDMGKDASIELLERISRVEPPPFLFTRIEARIDGRVHAAAPKHWVLVVGLSLVVLLAVNTLAIQKRIQQNGSAGDVIPELASGMGWRTSNQLYNE